MATKGIEILVTASLQALPGPELTGEQAALILQQSQDAVVFALLALAKQLTERQPIALSAVSSGQTLPHPRLRAERLPIQSRPASDGPKAPIPDSLATTCCANAGRLLRRSLSLGLSQVPRTCSTMSILANPDERKKEPRHKWS